MKEFIENLIGRLEEIKSDNFASAVVNEPYSMGICHTIEKSISIVNQLAEEYKTTYMEELIKAKRICAHECRPECPFRLEDGKCFLEELQAKLENKEQHNDQNLTIVESLPSLYPMMQSFEVEAIYRVVERGKYSDGWISCSKRLPEKSGRYIVTIKNATRATTLHYFEGSWHDGISQHYEVIAWQPLPAPYQPKGE